MLATGLSSQKDANAGIQQYCDKVKAQAEQHARKKFATFTAKSYRASVLGLGIFIKVHVGGEEYAHLHVFQKSGDPNLEFKGIQYPKTLQDRIVHF